jgi:hypothetical protein
MVRTGEVAAFASAPSAGNPHPLELDPRPSSQLDDHAHTAQCGQRAEAQPRQVRSRVDDTDQGEEAHSHQRQAHREPQPLRGTDLAWPVSLMFGVRHDGSYVGEQGDHRSTTSTVADEPDVG